MLAPSGEGLILYQAYGNLYAITGRKAYLLEDKQIPSVGVFDEMAFGGNTCDLGSFGEKTDEIMDLHQILEEILLIEHKDGIAGIKRRHRDPSSNDVRDFVTAFGRSRKPAFVCIAVNTSKETRVRRKDTISYFHAAIACENSSKKVTIARLCVSVAKSNKETTNAATKKVTSASGLDSDIEGINTALLNAVSLSQVLILLGFSNCTLKDPA
ncbi:hypothetical protein Tco_0272956 [Tanacetum coccineum]